MNKRITKRGWLALISLIAAFSLGISKEIVLHAEKEKAAEENSKLTNELTTLK